MPDYRRAFCPGGTFFFTVNLLQRRGNDLLVRHVDHLRDVVRTPRKTHPPLAGKVGRGMQVVDSALLIPSPTLPTSGEGEFFEIPVREVRRAHPFHIHGWVVLPEHLHAVIELPEGDANFSMRWQLIKTAFSKRLPADEHLSRVRLARGERGIWQRRFWEHLIRDEADFSAHMDYLHFNPVKHGHVAQVADWPFSTFHRLVAAGVYPHDWAGSVGADRVDVPD